MTHAASAPNDPVFLLRKFARLWLAACIGRFGWPARIAQIMSRHVRRVIEARVGALEALTMKLLLIEAANLAPPASSRQAAAKPIAAKGAAPASRKPAVRPLDLAHPESWRVRFELRIPPAPRPPWRPAPNTGPRIRDLGPPRTVRDIFADHAQRARLAQLAAARAARSEPSEARERAKSERLARRVEALRRALDNSATHARRLLRKLRALQANAQAAAHRIAARRISPSDFDPEIQRRAQLHARAAIPPLIIALNSS